LLKNAHLLRCPHPSSLRRTGLYVSLLGLPAAGRDLGRLVSERFWATCEQGLFPHPTNYSGRAYPKREASQGKDNGAKGVICSVSSLRLWEGPLLRCTQDGESIGVAQDPEVLEGPVEPLVPISSQPGGCSYTKDNNAPLITFVNGLFLLLFDWSW